MPPIRRFTVRKSTIPISSRFSLPSDSNPAGEESPSVSGKFSFDSELENTGISPALGESKSDSEGRAEEEVAVSPDDVVLVPSADMEQVESGIGVEDHVNGGNKQKKLVKKKVKVVRKMMMKVMKKVPKARIHGDAGFDHVPVIPNPSPNPNPTVSCTEQGSKGEKALMEFDGNVGGSNEAMYEQRERDENVGINDGRRERKTEIFVGGLDMDAKEEDIRKVFGEVGEIVDITRVNDDTVKNKGYAFVRYATAEEAKMALEKFSKVKICGQLCGATRVGKADTIYLGNIDKRWKDEDVLKLLKGIGVENIDNVRVMVKCPRQSELNHGFALVELETRKDAQIAYKKLQEEDVFGKHRTIRVEWAKPLTEPHRDDSPKKRHDTVNSHTRVSFKDGSWTDELCGDKFLSTSLYEGKRPAVYTSAPPPAKRNRCVASGCSSASLEVIHASTMEDPLLTHSPGGLVPSITALKEKVASLEKQMFDNLKRALKAEAAKSKAEEYSEKKLESNKNEIKALKKKHKDAIKKLKREHKAALKKADHKCFKKGKEYQLNLMKEALAFFDAEFRFHDFAPTLKYIEDERQKILEAATQQVRLEAEQAAARSKATEPIRISNSVSASPIDDEAIGEEDGEEEDPDEEEEDPDEEDEEDPDEDE